jgi:diaminopimelate epimerase
VRIDFTKMHGLGNDFVVLDARAKPLTLTPTIAARIADRRYGIGCDQILLIEAPTRADADIRYCVFNADGTTAEHCGNGVRCVAQYLSTRGQVRGQRVAVEIGAQTYPIDLVADGARVDMGVPRFAPAAIPLAVTTQAPHYALEFAGKTWQFGAVSVGNPHAVFTVDDTEIAPVEGLGSLLQHHPLFPQRVNVGFMQPLSRERIRLRVFERGVGETRACGTGACAAVAVGRMWGILDARIHVELRGGELTIEWSGESDSALIMTGPATEVFQGTIEL